MILKSLTHSLTHSLNQSINQSINQSTNQSIIFSATFVDSFLIVGDHGSTSRDAANKVATQMNNWAAANGADFVLSLGDNFYQDGPPSVSDSLFQSRWSEAYTGSAIKVAAILSIVQL